MSLTHLDRSALETAARKTRVEKEERRSI